MGVAFHGAKTVAKALVSLARPTRGRAIHMRAPSLVRAHLGGAEVRAPVG